MGFRNSTEAPLRLQKKSTKFEENAQKNQRFFEKIIFGYLMFGFIVSIFDLGKNTIARTFSNFMEKFIPSIAGIAAIAPNPDASSLILSVAWGLIIPFYVLAIGKVSIDGLKWNALNKPYRLFIVTIVTFIFCLSGFMKVVPTEKSVHVAGVIYAMIKSLTILTSILGLTIFVLLSTTAICATLCFICIYKQYRK